MKTIKLFCAHGFTTIMMRNKISQAASEEGLDYIVEAYSYNEIENQGSNADLILLAPQMGHIHESVVKLFPNTPVVVVDRLAYGTMDGAAIIKTIKNELEG